MFTLSGSSWYDIVAYRIILYSVISCHFSHIYIYMYIYIYTYVYMLTPPPHPPPAKDPRRADVAKFNQA